VNPTYPNYQQFLSLIDDQKFMEDNFFSSEFLDEEEKDKLQSLTGEELTKVSLKKVEWYPDEFVYELNISKRLLKKSEGLKRLQEWIRRAADCGLITRQELVSMLPPLMAEPTKDDVIMDMCAAPGSKTSQLLELIHHDFNKSRNADSLVTDTTNSNVFIKGGVVCNDIDSKRAWMLTHQVKRINTSAMLVTNHPGQLFPSLTRDDLPSDCKDKKFYFDKVLVDAPCSGDGAIRKLPIRWKIWNSNDGMGLHNVQISLLVRGLQITKIGGIVVYSTCS
jgi:16S rRNA C967 or C1407 C5-methylase (RsmB/RsmF family)